MTRRIDLDVEDLVSRYEAGASPNQLAKHFNISRRTIQHRLIEAGVTPRDASEANQLRWVQMTPEQRSAQVAAAHKASKGRVEREESKVLRAETRFRRSLGVSGYERQIAGLLLAAGYEVVHQLPVGPYNIDLALPACSIAVEVNGGHWHAYGRHLARRNRRLKQIFDEGWSCCEIWVGHDGLDLGGLGQHLVASIERMRSNPSSGCRHEMMTGTGEATPRLRSYGHDVAPIDHASRRDQVTGQYLRAG
jgi:very-short-patch-repair endonuclease